jgi:SAM-dependent methyltransferase
LATPSSINIDQIDELRPWLPAVANTIVEIGCGPGKLAVELAKIYPDAVIHLVDGDGTGPSQSSFQEECRPWSDVHAAMEYVLNQEPDCKVFAWTPEQIVNEVIPCDLVISIKSWCHHYPVETYLPFVRRSLRPPDGRIITDLRVNLTRAFYQRGFFRRAGFVELGVVKTKPKWERTVWKWNEG